LHYRTLSGLLPSMGESLEREEALQE